MATFARSRDLKIYIWICSFLRLPRNASATALSQQVPLRLMLGARPFYRKERRQASDPNCVP
jgi:hypothetical protein